MADLMRIGLSDNAIDETVAMLSPGVGALDAAVDKLISDEGKVQAVKQTALLIESGATPEIAEKIANIYKNVAACVRARLEGREPTALEFDFPTVQDGVRGMQFIQAVVTSSQDELNKWLTL